MPPSKFAESVVDEALSTSPRGWLWAGYMAWAIWLLHTFFGQRIFDGMLSKRFGVSEFAAMVKSGKAPLSKPA